MLATGAFSFLRCGAPAFDDARRPGCLVNETPLVQIKENEMKNINNWNWPLLVLISWFLYLVSAVWANLGTTQGIYTVLSHKQKGAREEAI